MKNGQRPRLSAVAALVVTVLGASCSTSNAPAGPSPAPATARYRVTFQATWSQATHPEDFPSAAHFSRLVGGTHSGAASFWREGTLATAGIKDMAERGRTTPLDQEIQAAIAQGTAQHVFTGGDIPISPGSVALEFDVSQTFPLVTLVSMIAPSPDWFVGVSALPLFQNGQWLGELAVDLVPWDAGTDSGATFASPDLATVPPQAVVRVVTAPLSPGGLVVPLGTFRFTRLTPP